MKTVKHRDLTLAAIPGGTLVIACDSCGAVGEKPHDRLRVPPYYAGRSAARVALMEVLASGAQVVAVTDAVCCEMEPTGREIIRGVMAELSAAAVDVQVLGGSTEENFPTLTTGLGVTVVGFLPGEGAWNRSRGGDRLYCVGLPKVGAEVDLEGDGALASYADIRSLLGTRGIRELIPVGSRGIGWEAAGAAAYNGLCFVPEPACALDLRKSAGPATCLLAIAGAEGEGFLRSMTRAHLVGRLAPRG